jgi:hypothetical protein
MAITQKRLFGPVVAVTSDTDTTAGRYLVPDSTTTIVKQLLFCNTGSDDYSVKAGIGSTSAAVRFISDLWISPNETSVFNCNIVLSAGEKLFVTATNAAVTVLINGVEES